LLTFDKSGNLYGTTESGGLIRPSGTVFELSHNAGGWTETVLYNFCSNFQGDVCVDGDSPFAGVTFDAAGNLCGTTYGGGTTGENAAGTLYELAPGASGWTETVLATFAARKQYTDTAAPGPVSIDPAGNLYTTQAYGGNYIKGGTSFGAVDRLSAKGVPDTFRFDGADGCDPYYGVLVDLHLHVLYGTTPLCYLGNQNYSFGNIYRIDSSGKQTVLYSFCSQPYCSDGESPAGLLEDKLGNLYGVTYEGGAYYDSGVVFELTP
jgi:hypothetical protein